MDLFVGNPALILALVNAWKYKKWSKKEPTKPRSYILAKSTTGFNLADGAGSTRILLAPKDYIGVQMQPRSS